MLYRFVPKACWGKGKKLTELRERRNRSVNQVYGLDNKVSVPMDTLFLSPLDSFHMKPSVFGSWQFLVVSLISLLGAESSGQPEKTEC